MFDDLHILYWHWFAVAAVLGTIEILAPGIFFLWLAVAAFVTGLLVAVLTDMPLNAQLLVFGGLSVVSVFFGWKFIKRNPQESPDPTLNLRSAQYVGKVYTLESAIHGGTGRVKIGDSTWKVEGPDMVVGTQVRVISYDGPTLRVEKAGDPLPSTPAVPHHNNDDPRIDPLQDSLKDPIDRSGS